MGADARPTVIAVYTRHNLEKYTALTRAALPEEEVVPVASEEELLALGPAVEIVFGWRIPPGVVRLPNLRWIQAMGAGVEDLVALPLPPHVQIARVVGQFGVAIAEHVFGYLLFYLKGGRRTEDAQRRHAWEPFTPPLLSGRRLGVAGLGSIGQEVARLGLAFGLEVSGLSRSGATPPGLRLAAVYPAAQKAAFLDGLDILVLALPHTPATADFLDAPAIERLAPGAIVVNVGRGALVDEAALLDALESGRLGGAILDVFRSEPLPPEHPFWSRSDVIVTPHVSGPSRAAAVTALFAENVRRHRRGEPLLGLVDRQRGY
jgi:phosphoglycerate dehydrogenase-like enzyme